MYSVLEAIYHGAPVPSEHIRPHGSEYDRLNKKLYRTIEQFQAQLPDADWPQLDSLLGLLAEVQSFELTEHFRCGAALGVLLMQEVFSLQEHLV